MASNRWATQTKLNGVFCRFFIVSFCFWFFSSCWSFFVYFYFCFSVFVGFLFPFLLFINRESNRNRKRKRNSCVGREVGGI